RSIIGISSVRAWCLESDTDGHRSSCRPLGSSACNLLFKLTGRNIRVEGASTPPYLVSPSIGAYAYVCHIRPSPPSAAADPEQPPLPATHATTRCIRFLVCVLYNIYATFFHRVHRSTYAGEIRKTPYKIGWTRTVQRPRLSYAVTGHYMPVGWKQLECVDKVSMTNCASDELTAARSRALAAWLRSLQSR
ncbi:hypothetical protein K488DRAFT_74584, partial [Vararia minispora EC-137]